MFWQRRTDRFSVSVLQKVMGYGALPTLTKDVQSVGITLPSSKSCRLLRKSFESAQQDLMIYCVESGGKSKNDENDNYCLEQMLDDL